MQQVCQIAVHQECYGVRNTQDFALWVCRACETPEVERECCLCPGGALKPTDIGALWVHVTCTWFRLEVAFLDPEKMEPAVAFLKSHQTHSLRHVLFAHRFMVLACSVASVLPIFMERVLLVLDIAWNLHCSDKNGTAQVTNQMDIMLRVSQ
ncbi:hypothetical protein CASFOL_020516 [Castilleja foliolosa]|uniref:PHD-type domain-containing protein n=1 Tax=Castilleja foliolosa TaxID=1961234 RepID=A0ABD3D2D8_9LAMI